MANKTYTGVFGRSSTISQAVLRTKGTTDIVRAIKSIRDLDDDCPRQILEILGKPSSSTDGWTVFASSPCLKKPDLVSVSPSGKKTLTATSDGDDKITLLVDMDDGDDLSFALKVDASDKHGRVSADMHFGGVSWSQDERLVAYVARVKEPKRKSFFDKALATTEASTSEDAVNSVAGNKFDFVEDWGEKNVGLHSTVLCVLDTAKGAVHVVSQDRLPLHTTVGQPLFRPGSRDARLIFSAWRARPKRLGKLYCTHRPCGLYEVDIEAKGGESSTPHTHSQLLTDGLAIAHSPRSTPDGSALVFLGRQQRMATHHGCFAVYRHTLSTGENTVLVEVQEMPVAVESPTLPMGFPGIFASQLLEQPFISADEFIINTQWRSAVRPVVVHATTGAVGAPSTLAHLMTRHILPKTGNDAGDWNNSDLASCRAIDIHDGKIFFGASTPTVPERYGVLDTRLVNTATDSSNSEAVHRLPPNPSPRITITSTDPRPVLEMGPESLSWKTFTLTDHDGIEFEGTLMLPRGISQVRLMVVPHGGPHSCTPTSFVPSYAFMALHLHCAILHCNYRGSVGWGQRSVDSLPGHIGTNDVQDVMALLDHALSIEPRLCPHKIGVVGGSHGGFLTGHLIGQFPEKFRVAAMRNPVTNIPPMVTVSDIPDWCYVEALGLEAYDFDAYTAPQAAHLVAMHACSPIAHVHKVTTPTLMCIGEKDLRVPKSQGFEYYHVLRSQGVATKMICFPEDTHAIDRPLSEASHWISIANWVDEHMPM